MKKALTLILVLWCSTAWAVEPINLARSNPYVLGAGVAGASCDTATNEIGNRDQEATTGTIAINYAWVFRAQADCSGTLADAYIYHDDTGITSAKICIYNSTNADLASEGAGATLVGCATVSSTSTTGWKSSSIGSGEVTSGSYYWVTIFKEDGNAHFVTKMGAAVGKTIWSKSASGYYDSVPDPLPNSGWTENADAGDPSVYVQIGP